MPEEKPVKKKFKTVYNTGKRPIVIDKLKVIQIGRGMEFPSKVADELLAKHISLREVM